MVAQAIPSVSPGKGAQYFHKTECFCFEEQLLQPGEKLTMPVRFIIDPDLPDDVPVLTHGYTHFDITESHIKLQARNKLCLINLHILFQQAADCQFGWLLV